MTDFEEARLIKKIQNGDCSAFEKLVNDQKGRVYNIIFNKVHNREDAEDLTQETFIKLWKGLSSYRHECRISTYIYRIAVNVSIDHIRKEAGKDEKSLSDYDDSDSYEGQMQIKDGNEDVSPESAYLKKEKLEEIKRGFDLLSPEMREVIRLRDVLGYSYSEISEMLDIPDGTVKSRLIRARLTVKKYLEQRNICPASSSKVTESDENG